MQILKLTPKNLKQIKSILSNNYLFKLNVIKNVNTNRYFSESKQMLKNIEEPVKFSTSKAKNWDPIDSFMSKETRTQPKSQPFIVVLCVSIFLTYFLLLREENEIDVMIAKPLEDKVPNIKEMTLKHQILKYEQMGLDTKALREALAKELENKKLNNK